MPHWLDVNGSFVLRWAVLLKVKGGEEVNWFIHSSLEHYVACLKVMIWFLHFSHRFECDSDCSWDVLSTINMRVFFLNFLNVIFSWAGERLFDQFHLWSQVTEDITQFFHVELIWLYLSESGIEEDHPCVFFMVSQIHLKGYCAS